MVSQSQNLFYLVVGLCMLMMAVSVYHPLGLSIISNLFSKCKLTKMIGIHGATGEIGQGLGIISMSFMIASYGWRLCYLLWSILLFAWSIVLMKSRISPPQLENHQITEEFNYEEEESPSLTSWKHGILQKIMTSKNFILLILAMSVAGLGNQTIFSFTTIYFVQVRKMSEDLAALIFGIGPLIGVFGSLFGGYLGSTSGDRKFLSLAFFALMFSVFSLAYAPFIGFVILSFLIYRLFFASIWPASTSLVTTSTRVSSRGMTYSIFFLMPGILGAVSPIIGVLIIQGFGILSIFPFASTLFLLSSVAILLIKD